ncbi:MAG: 2-phospho-L-lactate guanylyltransferase, partial [Alphaproteobacteria bacterium]
MSRKATWAVVPVKVLDRAKRRLAGVFDPEARIALSLAMLSDVLSALTAVEGLDGVAVISRDARALDLARRTGARVIFEAPDDGLNGALRAAARILAAEGCANLLVLPADVPLASPAEISQILTAQGAVPNVILVPESNGPGTNALACSPPEAIAPRFGEESFARHLEAARARGLQPKVLRLAGIGLDIDTPADLGAFCALPGASRTHRFLQQCRGLEEGFRPRGAAFSGARLTREEALALSDCTDLDALMEAAAGLCQQGHGGVVSYSRKVFIPLTKLCRDVCHYCTFARPPRRGEAAYLAPERVLDIARQGAAAGCKEALFTLGDKPELRYRAAREALAVLGHDSTLSYLAEMARLVFAETGLFPHLNPGVMNRAEIADLREVSVSQGLMLESASARLCAKGGPHHG